MGLPREFALIARHFRPLAGDGALDLSDDAALLTPPAGQQLVLAADALVEGVHFLPDDPPGMIARKLLRVNLSDLAAMGAAPLGYLMTTAFTRGTSDSWIADFVAGLAEDQQRYGITVLGGDTVATPGPACFSLTIIGTVPPGQALHRRGARIGDEVWVSGSIGDGALGLRVLQGKLAADAEGHLARRYRLPEPRLALGQAPAFRGQAQLVDKLTELLGRIGGPAFGRGRITGKACPQQHQAAGLCAVGARDRDLVVGQDVLGQPLGAARGVGLVHRLAALQERAVGAL